MSANQIDSAVRGKSVAKFDVTSGVELVCIDAGNTTTAQAKCGRLRVAEIDNLFEATVLQEKRTNQGGGFRIKVACDAGSPQFHRTRRTTARAAVAYQQSGHQFGPYHSVG